MRDIRVPSPGWLSASMRQPWASAMVWVWRGQGCCLAHRRRPAGRSARRRAEVPLRVFALLEYFMRHVGQVLSRQQILSAIWDYDFEPASNVVDVYVRHLRNKVDPPGAPSLIQTVRGAGYRFNPAPG